jgi:hypothetical protein
MASYITLADAEIYMSTYRLVTSAWDASDDATKTKALAMATKLIDQLSFDGDKADADQDNQFPRGSDTSVPTEIQEACAECAYSLLDGVDVEFEYDNLRNVSMGFANVRSSNATGMIPEHKSAGIPSYIAWRLLLPFLRSSDSIEVMRTS